jgi:hypothetical protein
MKLVKPLILVVSFIVAVLIDWAVAAADTTTRPVPGGLLTVTTTTSPGPAGYAAMVAGWALFAGLVVWFTAQRIKRRRAIRILP